MRTAWSSLSVLVDQVLHMEPCASCIPTVPADDQPGRVAVPFCDNTEGFDASEELPQATRRSGDTLPLENIDRVDYLQSLKHIWAFDDYLISSRWGI